MVRDIAITCEHAETFCDKENTMIYCKAAGKICGDVVKDGTCIGKHKQEKPNQPDEIDDIARTLDMFDLFA